MAESKKALLLDRITPAAIPLTRFRSSFSLRTGIFTASERITRQGIDSLIYAHPDPDLETLIAKSENFTPYRSLGEVGDDGLPDIEKLQKEFLIVTPEFSDPIHSIEETGSRIAADLSLINTEDNGFLHAHNHPSCWSLDIVGDPKDVFIHSSAQILPGSVIDAREGHVVIDAETEISPFSFIQGPVYIGKSCRIDDARITGGVILGNQVRIGGEVENSIFNDFSNKHHEGFVGHSVIGSWVNLGALTTTSDLKNNYGEIRLQIPDSIRNNPENGNFVRPKTSEYSTGKIKFGSIIGDYVKTAIGTMINTGSVIDAGANIFGKNPGKYAFPLQWGDSGEHYRMDRFLNDCEKIMARRGKVPSGSFGDLVAILMTGAPKR